MILEFFSDCSRKMTLEQIDSADLSGAKRRPLQQALPGPLGLLIPECYWGCLPNELKFLTHQYWLPTSLCKFSATRMWALCCTDTGILALKRWRFYIATQFFCGKIMGSQPYGCGPPASRMLISCLSDAG